MPDFALVAPFPGLVETVGVKNDLGPHVTVLVPCPDDIVAITEVLGPFVAMTEAMVERFPDYPPYGGLHDRIVPHLTVAQTELDESAALVEPFLPLHSRVEEIVLYAHAQADHWHEVHTFDL